MKNQCQCTSQAQAHNTLYSNTLQTRFYHDDDVTQTAPEDDRVPSSL